MQYNCEVVRGRSIIARLLSIVSPFGGYIAGGFARWALTIEDPIPTEDIDVYFQDEDKFYELSALLYSWGCSVQYTSRFGITWKIKGIDFPVQTIYPHAELCGDPPFICNVFDIDVCRAAVWVENNNIQTFANFNINDNNRTTSIHCARVYNPISTGRRLDKYKDRGFAVQNSEYVFLDEIYYNATPEQRSKWGTFTYSGMANPPEGFSISKQKIRDVAKLIWNYTSDRPIYMGEESLCPF